MGDSMGVQQQIDALSRLQHLPPGSLPNICRTVFVAGDTATLSALYDLGRQYIGSSNSSSDGQQLTRAITAAAAAWTLLTDSQPSKLILKQFVQDLFLPLVSALGDTAQATQQLQQLAELLASKQAWQVTLEVLQCAHVSLDASLQRDSSSVSDQEQLAGLQLAQVQLLPHAAASVVQQLVAAVSCAAGRARLPAQETSLQHDVLQLAAGPLFDSALQLLCSPDSRMRQAAFQQLLPELLQAAAALGAAQHRVCLDQLLQQCLDMVSRPVVPRRVGLAVLLQYWSDWQLQPPSAQPEGQGAPRQQSPKTSAAACSSERFWQLVRECLVDPEALNRKRALRLLQLLLPKDQLQAEPVWGVLLALYELLDEFTPHLVKATWPMISHLHGPAAAYASEDTAADIRSSGKINMLSRGMQTASGQPPAQQQAPMAFCWSSIIWTQALQHNNLQVQRMAMKTLLKRDWSAQVLQQVPASFFTQVLLPALLSPLHYNTQLSGNLANSGAVLDKLKQQQQPGSSSSSSDEFDVTQHAAQLLSSYVQCAGGAAARELFSGGMQVALTLRQDLSRAGLQALLQVLAAAAGQVQEGQLLQDLPQTEAEVFAEASLRQLQAVLTCFMIWHGNSYKAACSTSIVKVAAAVAPPGSCSLTACARLLQEVPPCMLCPGTDLGAAAKAWLAGSKSQGPWLAEAANSMWQQYLASSSSGGNTGPDGQQLQFATTSDYAVWGAASDAWLRVVLCCSNELQPLLTSAATQLAASADQVMSRSYLPFGLPDRVLIVTTQLLEAADIAGRAACQGSTAHVPALTRAALQFAAGAGGSALVRLLHLHCSCYFSSPAELAGTQPGTPAGRHSTGAGLGLCPAAWQAAARAESTAQAAAAAAVLMAQHLAAGQHGSAAVAAGGQAMGVSVQQVLTSLVQLMQQMAATGQALAAKPLPCVSVDKAASDRRAALGPAAAELSRASAILAMRHLSQGLSRALSCLPQQHWSRDALPLQPAAWVTALIRETTAAAEATTHWEPVLAAAAGTVGDVTAGWINGLDWACLDACMSLVGLMHSGKAAASANGSAGATAAANGVSAQAAGAPASAASCGTERLPAGVLAPDVLVRVLVEALNALQWTPPDVLVHLMRCVRRVWALAVQDSSLQAAALQALEVAGLGASYSSGADSTELLAALAASLTSNFLQLMHASRRQSKRPLVLCGALINTMMLPELMMFDPQQQPQLVTLHAGPSAPLRRFVGGLLQPGAKGSPTLYLAVALRLAACIPAAPYLLQWYAAELQQLVLFGTVMEAGVENKLLLGPEAATEWSLLAEPIEPHLATAGVIAGMGPRIAVVAALHQLAAAAGLVQDSTQRCREACNGSSTAAGSADTVLAAAAVCAGVGLWRQWIQVVLHDPVLSAENHRHGSEAHRGKVRLWQGVSAATAFLGCPSQREAATMAVKELLAALERVNAPSVKQYQEASLTYLLLQHQHLIQELLLPQLTDLEKGGPATASHILSAVQACLNSTQQEQLLPQLVELLLPWTNHHTHNIRTFAQLGLCAVLDAKPLDSWPAWEQGLGQGGVAMVQALQRFFNGNTDFQRFRRSIGAGMLSWGPDTVVTPAGIFCTSLSLTGNEEGTTAVTFEGCPQSLMDTVVHFLHEERAKLRLAAADKEAAEAAAEAAHSIGAGADGSQAAGSGLQLDYQRKVTPSERAVLLADVLDDAYEAAQGGSSGPAGTCRHELIVVASLIDKVPNLAGLARTAEVLGAGTLVLADIRVASDQLFTSISVTAERWVPMLEVKESALLGWLRQQKAAGYSLVGLEQTAESTQLPSFTFPSKTVLVLGREKEGVPPEIIALLDATVEIPQLGVIRSLNVHVSGAIAMYEYTKQQLQAQQRAG